MFPPNEEPGSLIHEKLDFLVLDVKRGPDFDNPKKSVWEKAGDAIKGAGSVVKGGYDSAKDGIENMLPNPGLFSLKSG
jgi:hypothetical protein